MLKEKIRDEEKKFNSRSPYQNFVVRAEFLHALGEESEGSWIMSVQFASVVPEKRTSQASRRFHGDGYLYSSLLSLPVILINEESRDWRSIIVSLSSAFAACNSENHTS